MGGLQSELQTQRRSKSLHMTHSDCWLTLVTELTSNVIIYACPKVWVLSETLFFVLVHIYQAKLLVDLKDNLSTMAPTHTHTHTHYIYKWGVIP